MHAFVPSDGLVEEFIIESERVLLSEIVVALPIMRLNNIGFCGPRMKLHLVLVRGVKSLQFLLMLGNRILLLDESLGWRLVLLSGSQEVVVIEDLIERVLLPIVVPNYKLLAEHVHSFVHQSDLLWLYELSLRSTLVHRFFLFHFFSHPGGLL
jgi:hypothetical protein